MSLLEKIISIYPQLANFDFTKGVILLQNDSNGNGDYIKVWNHPTLTQPTQAQLDSAE
jgi:hypothetical protein